MRSRRWMVLGFGLWSSSCGRASAARLEDCFVAEGSVPCTFLVGVTARSEDLAQSPPDGTEFRPFSPAHQMFRFA